MHMTANEIADLFIVALGKIEFFWNFYVATILIFLGWFISTRHRISKQAKTFLISGYLLFAAMNVFGLWSSYELAEALRLDLLAHEGFSVAAMPNSHEALASRVPFENMKWVTIAIHVIMLVGFSWVLFMSPFGKEPGE